MKHHYLIALAPLLLVGAVPVAEAANRCPSGQIWRVSKKSCMAKGDAVKLGIVRPGASAKSTKPVARPERVAVATPVDNSPEEISIPITPEAPAKAVPRIRKASVKPAPVPARAMLESEPVKAYAPARAATGSSGLLSPAPEQSRSAFGSVNAPGFASGGSQGTPFGGLAPVQLRND